MPTTIRSFDGFVMIASLFLAFFLLCRSRMGLSSDAWLQLLVFAGLGFWARRLLPWYGFILAPVLAAVLAGQPGGGWRGHIRPGIAWLNAILILLILSAFLLSLPWLRPGLASLLGKPTWRYVTANTPVQATDYLCQSTPTGARVFQDQAFSSYQIWACPKLSVFVDTRIELYPGSQWEDYLALSCTRYDWQVILDRYNVDTLFLSQDSQAPLIKAAAQSPTWRQLYEDETAAIFRR